MTAVYVLIAVLVLAFVIARQLRPQPVTSRRIRIAAVLAVVGAVQVVSTAAGAGAPGALGWSLLITGLVIGAALGVWRSATMRLWFTDGRALVQGSTLTLVLWIVGIAAHVGLDLLGEAVDPASGPVNSSSVLLFIAVTLGAQFLATTRRVRAAQPVPV